MNCCFVEIYSYFLLHIGWRQSLNCILLYHIKKYYAHRVLQLLLIVVPSPPDQFQSISLKCVSINECELNWKNVWLFVFSWQLDGDANN